MGVLAFRGAIRRALGKALATVGFPGGRRRAAFPSVRVALGLLAFFAMALPTLAQSAVLLSQPQDVRAASSANANFSVSARDAVDYYWEERLPGTSAFGDVSSGIVGARTSTLTVPAMNWRNGAAYRVWVLGADGNEIVSDIAVLTVAMPIRIFSLEPYNVPTSGNVEVTITGQTFAGVERVTIGGVDVPFTIESDTTMVVTAPPGEVGYADLVLTAGSESTHTSLLYGEATEAPVITGISPAYGQLEGGERITITGEYFSGAHLVMIGDETAIDVIVESDTQISFIAPGRGAPGFADIFVATPWGGGSLEGAYTYLSSRLDGLSLSAGTLTPAFDRYRTDYSATVDTNTTSVVVSPTFWDARQVAIIAGEALSHGQSSSPITLVPGENILKIRVLDQLSLDSTIYTVAITRHSGAPPAILVHPADVIADKGGTAVFSVVAENAATYQWQIRVPPAADFHDVPGLPEVSGQQTDTLTISQLPVSADGTHFRVAVTDWDRGRTIYSDPAKLSIRPAIRVDRVEPDSGGLAGGESVTIRGAGFTSEVAVTFGPQSASYTFVSSTELTARVPPGMAAGPVDVVVSTRSEDGRLPNGYTYREENGPMIGSIAPSSGPVTGETRVVITGEHLNGATAVTFGGVPALDYVVNGDRELVAMTPPHGGGPVDVVVTTPIGEARLAGGFRYEEEAPGAFVFSPPGGALAEAMAGEDYRQAITATGGTGTLLYSLEAGRLPRGVVLNTATGELTGPIDDDAQGNYAFTIGVADRAGTTGSAGYTLVVKPRGISVSSRKIDVPAGSTPLPVRLDEGATGGPFSDAQIVFVDPPQAGTATVSHGDVAQAGPVGPLGWYLKFSPAKGFAGEARIGFRLRSALGTSGVGVITLVIAYDPEKVVEETHALLEGFVETRMGLVASSLQVPGLLERRRLGSGGETVSTSFSPSQSALAFNFATSLAQMSGAGAQDDQMPRFNLWIDGTVMAHNRSGDDDRWGSFAMLSAGADYLLSEKALVGVAFHVDRMVDPAEEHSTLTGAGWLAGPYGSFELGEGVFWDTGLFFGGSANDIDTLSWDGAFDTRRWVFDTMVTGHWQLDETTRLTPRLKALYLSETVDDYEITNAAGDTLAIDGFTSEQLRISVGGELARLFPLSGGVMLTPSIGVDAGLSPLQKWSAFGSLSAGLTLTQRGAWSVNGRLMLNMDTIGTTSMGARASLQGGF